MTGESWPPSVTTLENSLLSMLRDGLLASVIQRRIPEDDPAFCSRYLYIRDKAMQVTPLILNAAQRHLAERLTGRDLILKARQLGMSTFIQARQFRHNVTRTSAAITLSDTFVNTEKLRAIYNRFYEQWPREHMGLRPARDKNSAANVTYPALQSESVITAAGVKTAGQGGTYSHLHGSEVAFWKDVENIFARTLQAATPDAEIILESTPNGAQGKFYELCMSALDGNPDWYLHFYPWWWAPEYRLSLDVDEQLTYTEEEQAVIVEAARSGFHLTPEQIKWRRAKKRELPHTFKQEYPEDPYSCFLSSGIGFFGDLSHCFLEPGELKPQSDRRYVGGIDWGQSEDWTVLSIIDVAAKCQVGLYRWRRLPWQVMRQRIYEACRHWGVSLVLVEINSIGGVNYEELNANMGAIQLLPFTTTAQSKPAMIQALYRGLHEQGLKLINDSDRVQRAEFAAFQATQSPQSMKWSYGAAKGQHDDCVIATGLSWLMAERPAVGRIRTLE